MMFCLYTYMSACLKDTTPTCSHEPTHCLTCHRSGQSKGDNLHHWGYPEHSFWCCYGAAVESFAKLADSIYFWEEATGGRRPLVGGGHWWEVQAITIHRG